MLTEHRGFFGKGEMQKEFEEASFKLEPGQTSGIVETASGLHIIQRYEIIEKAGEYIQLTERKVGMSKQDNTCRLNPMPEINGTALRYKL